MEGNGSIYPQRYIWSNMFLVSIERFSLLPKNILFEERYKGTPPHPQIRVGAGFYLPKRIKAHNWTNETS